MVTLTQTAGVNPASPVTPEQASNLSLPLAGRVGRGSLRNMKLLIEYDGSEFSGWQQQRGLRTVEGELRKALGDLLGRDVTLYAAGRTDAGAAVPAVVLSDSALAIEAAS